MSATFDTVDVTLEPNDKYDEVIRGEPATDDAVESIAKYREQTMHLEATEAYLETINNTPDPEDFGHEPDDLDPVSWDDISPSQDPDLVAKIATYFDGMTSDESTGRLRAKCRLLDVKVYINAQIAARAELREE